MKAGNHTRVGKVVLALGVLALGAWLGPSFLSAERYRRRLEAGLERVLKRPVSFGSVSLRLLPRPGFSAENVVVREAAGFGSEPFARVDRMDCDLRWRSLWRAQLEFSRLRFVRPSLNVVRNERAEWNVENLLEQSGFGASHPPTSAAGGHRGNFTLEADEGRLNFKVGADKKAFAIVDLEARLDVDPAGGVIRYRVAGNPVRTDLATPPPGVVELAGEWRPGRDLGGQLTARLRTRGALLYNWVPLVVDDNPGIYGVVDADVRLGGSLRAVQAEGDLRLTQLHRWELVPPSEPLPFAVHFRGAFDRRRGRALVETLDASFGESRLHITGAVDRIPHATELDLVVALERARLEDLQAVGRSLWRLPENFKVTGRVDGQMSIVGPWAERRYGGFVGAREVRLISPAGTFPASEVAIRIGEQGVILAPVGLTLVPRVEVIAEGVLHRSRSNGARRKEIAPRYELTLTGKSLPLAELARVARELRVPWVQGLDVRGFGNATVQLSGVAWPLAKPSVAVRADLRAARLVVPGLTEPLHIPRARVQAKDGRVTADPVVAVLGTSVFTGRLERQAARHPAWAFQIKTKTLSWEQSALWFEALGRRPPPLLERIPGLRTLSGRRAAASNLFAALHARGGLEVGVLSYRSLRLEDFRARMVISGRAMGVEEASFVVGGGQGHGTAKVDLTDAPARIEGKVALAGIKLAALAPRLPEELREIQGLLSGEAQFQTRGLTREELSANLQASGVVRLKNVSLGGFAPLPAIARRVGWALPAPVHAPVVLRSLTVPWRVERQRVLVPDQPIEVGGSHFRLAGSYSFSGHLDLDVRADLSKEAGHRLVAGGTSQHEMRLVRLRLEGPLTQLTVRPEVEVSQAGR